MQVHRIDILPFACNLFLIDHLTMFPALRNLFIYIKCIVYIQDKREWLGSSLLLYFSWYQAERKYLDKSVEFLGRERLGRYVCS